MEEDKHIVLDHVIVIHSFQILDVHIVLNMLVHTYHLQLIRPLLYCLHHHPFQVIGLKSQVLHHFSHIELQLLNTH